MTSSDPEAGLTAGQRAMLRHTVATLAYRGGKALRDAPSDFGQLRVGERTRTPLQILAHMGDLMEWALSQASGGETWHEATPGSWEDQVTRFFAGLAALDAYLATDQALGQPAGKIFQGAIADALTHVGQINLLRGMAGSSVRGENYNKADIVSGRVGPEQSEPRREFD